MDASLVRRTNQLLYYQSNTNVLSFGGTSTPQKLPLLQRSMHPQVITLARLADL